MNQVMSVSAHCHQALGDSVLRLSLTPQQLLRRLSAFGAVVVTTLTRAARSSQVMRFSAGSEDARRWQYRDQRCLLRQQWLSDAPVSVMATLAPMGEVPGHALVLFDQHGEPLQWITLGCAQAKRAFDDMVCTTLHQDQFRWQHAAPRTVPDHIAELDGRDLERQWCLNDPIAQQTLSGYPHCRATLYRQLRPALARQIPTYHVAEVLAHAALQDKPITICLDNAGAALCLSAPWGRPRWQAQRCHLMHKGVMLSLEHRAVDTVWRLRRPAGDHIKVVIEALDKEGRSLWRLSAGKPASDDRQARRHSETAWQQLLQTAFDG